MQVDISKLASSSLFAGLQNLGSYSASTTVNGTIPSNGYLENSFVVNLPSPNVVTLIRFQAPNNSGSIASYWYPIMGTLTLYDITNKYYLTAYTASDPAGRRILLTFTNLTASTITVTNMNYNVVLHTYSFPW